MAYQGRKVWSAGDVLTASDMNSTVNQTNMVFADEAARTTAIPTPTAGMVTYIVALQQLQFWNGSEWTAVGTGTGSGGGLSDTFLLMGA